MHSWCTAAALYALLPLPHECAHILRPEHVATPACACRCITTSLPLDSEPLRLSHVVADVEPPAPHPAPARSAKENVVLRPRRFPPCLPAHLFVCVRALLCVCMQYLYSHVFPSVICLLCR